MAPTASSSGVEPPVLLDVLSIQLLGGFALRRGGDLLPPFPTQKSKELLAYLALHTDQDLVRHSLAYRLWPDAEESNAEDNFRQALRMVRSRLEVRPEDEGRIVATPRKTDVRFVPPPGWRIDAVEFEQLATRALSPALAGEERTAALKAAARLYRGPLLPDCYAEWCEPIRERLERCYEECLRALVEAHREQKQYARAVEWSRAALAHDPSAEVYHRQVMECLYLLGDLPGALRQYAECRRRLAELDLEPSAETEDLRRRIKNRPVVPPTVPSPPVLPYPELAPFTGRDRELARLGTAWGSARRGVGQLVFVSGEPGIGKSRLGQELLQFVGSTGGLAVYGQGYQSEGNLLYRPVTDALRMALSLAGQISLDRGSAGDLAQVARLVPELRDEGPELPPLPPDEESELLDGLCRFFLGLARQRPLCLFMDDLHWADDATLRCLHHLWQQSSGTPLLLVGAFREEEARDRPLLVGWRREAALRHPEAGLPLPRFSEAAVSDLLRQLGGGDDTSLPPGLAERLRQDTQGNPLFLLMSIRAMIEADQLVLDEARDWHLADGQRVLERLPLNPTMRHVILQRVERLRPAERRLLAAAAVLGQQFEFASLRQMAEPEVEELFTAVDWLLKSGLLREGDDGQLSFDHDRIREIVYEELSAPRRQALHLRAGEALATQLGGRAAARAAELARHFLLSRDPRATEPAVHYLLAAGAAARNLSAHAEAERHLETALELLDGLSEDDRHLELRGRVVDDLSRAYRGQGQLDRGKALLQEYIERCRRGRYPAGEARGCTWLAEFHLLACGALPGRPELTPVEACYRRAIDLCVRHDLADWVSKPRLSLAFYYWRLRPNLPELERLLGDVTADLDRHQQQDIQRALTMLMGVHAARERWEDARAAFTRSLAHGGPDPLFFYHLLAEWEERLEQAGRREWFATLCREWQTQALRAGIRDLPRQWLLEAAVPAAGHGKPLLDVRFADEPLPPELAWVDPTGVGGLELQLGKSLTLAPPYGPELWPHTNLNAPRLMFPIQGNFIAETRVEIGEANELAAGLLLWGGERDFIRLERVRGVQGDGIQLEVCAKARYHQWGRGRLTAQVVWLRLERFGGSVRALCSEDREKWWTCGSATFEAGNPAQVGIACIPMAAGAAASFERFTVWRGASDRERDG